MTTVKPTLDRVLVRLLVKEGEVKTSGGIIIPDTAKEKPVEAIVMEVGPGKVTESGVNIKINIKPGQRVLLGKYSGQEVKLSGEDLLIVKESDILAIVE